LTTIIRTKWVVPSVEVLKERRKKVEKELDQGSQQREEGGFIRETGKEASCPARA
jgi:F0F1-type ATP synthase membrane subunit b/b'